MAHDPAGNKIMSLNQLKKENTNFNNVLESVRLLKRDVLSKSDDYTVTTQDFQRNTVIVVSGSVYGTTAALTGGVNLTLPSASSDLTGCSIDVYSIGAGPVTASMSEIAASNPGHTISGSNTVSNFGVVSGKGLGAKLNIFCDGTRMINSVTIDGPGGNIEPDLEVFVTST